MIRVESIPMQGIGDAPTRAALDVLQRNIQALAGDNSFATKADLDALKRVVGTNASQPSTVTTRVITPETPPPVTGDFVKRTGDLMSGRLGITRVSFLNGTVEGQGIQNIGSTTYDRAELYSQFTTYGVDDVVAEGGYIWNSLQAGNINHTPSSSPTWWGRAAIECQTWVKGDWAIGVTYDAFDTVHDVSTNVIWTSLQNGNVGHTPGAAPLWWSAADPIDQHFTGPGPTYAIGDVVRYGNALWTSLQASNIGRYPYPKLWDIAKTYAVDDQVRYTNGTLYTSLGAGNIGNQPDISPGDWAVAAGNIWWAGATAVLNGLQSNSFGLNGAGLGVTFGAAVEAWNGGYPTTAKLGIATHADRTLVGFEPSVINRNPNSTQAKVATDFTFKNRADTEYFTPMPLGNDRYNIHARATQYSSFPRSPTGERCGWPTLRKINQFSLDVSADQPYSVDTDMYDQSVDNSGQDVWWRWWASGNVYDPVGQPLGREAGVRYNQSNKMLEFYSDIVNQGGANSLVATISFDPALWADQHSGIPMVMNSGLFPMRAVFNETIKFISVGPTSTTNFVNASATGAAGNPFSNPANVFPTGFFEFHIDGSSKRFAYYNP